MDISTIESWPFTEATSSTPPSEQALRWSTLCGRPDDPDRPNAVCLDHIVEAGLDPARRSARFAIVELEFPELVIAADEGDEDVDVDGYDVVDPLGTLHAICAVTGQLWNGQPSIVSRTAARLTALGLRRREILLEFAFRYQECVEPVYDLATGEHEPMGDDWYLSEIDELPERIVWHGNPADWLLPRAVDERAHDRVSRIVEMMLRDPSMEHDPVWESVVLHDLWRMYHDDNQYEAALTALRRAMLAEPDAHDREHMRAELFTTLLQAGHAGDAAEVLAEIASRAIPCPEVGTVIARALAAADDHELALTWQGRAIEQGLSRGEFGSNPHHRFTLISLAGLRRSSLRALNRAPDLLLDRADLELAETEHAFAARVTRVIGTRMPRVKQRIAADEPGRNDPCPCASGIKYKRCCLPSHSDRTQ